MKTTKNRIPFLLLALCGTFSLLPSGAVAQDAPIPPPAPVTENAKPANATVEMLKDKAEAAMDKAKQVSADAAAKAKDMAAGGYEKAKDIAADTTAKAREMAEQTKARAEAMANSEEGRKTADSVLKWIHSAELLYRPWLNWVLVMVGIALFISHAGQLVIGKLWKLIRGRGFDLGEIINDFLVAGFSAMGLPAVLILPVGGESFISNPFAVLSAAAVGMVLGVYLYGHGINQEMKAGQEDIEKKA